jgi:3-phosphoshikimate 1-carboxyvinyltransferase
MQRVLVAALLSRGTTIIGNPGKSQDEENMCRVIGLLGAQAETQPNGLSVRGGFHPVVDKMNIGESGLGIRLIIPVAALSDKPITIGGEGSLNNRPMGVIEKALQEAGAKCITTEGLLPVEIKGPLQGGTVQLDGSISSQFLSGLLFALPLAHNHSRILVKNLKSKPYIDMTLEVLKKFGINIENKNYEVFDIPGNQSYKANQIDIEGDWSNAAFFFTGAAIRGDLHISGLKPDSLQGDKKVLEAINACGANLKYKNGLYSIQSPTTLESFDFDATDTPDLFPPLSVLAAYCQGTSTIKGVHRLLYKESNRTEAIIKELTHMGINVYTQDDDKLCIQGGKLKGGAFHSHNDHRMAMAGAVTAMAAQNPVTITSAQAVGKSFPTFFDTLKSLNVRLEYIKNA